MHSAEVGVSGLHLGDMAPEKTYGVEENNGGGMEGPPGTTRHTSGHTPHNHTRQTTGKVLPGLSPEDGSVTAHTAEGILPSSVQRCCVSQGRRLHTADKETEDSGLRRRVE